MITWEYLAGFFDGEGCINYANSGSVRTYRVRLTFSQSRPRGYELLGRIKHFLELNGCKLGKIHTSGYIRDKEKQGWQLQIVQKDSVKLILNALMPYLEIKKLEAQDALRRTKLYPSFVGKLKGEKCHTV